MSSALFAMFLGCLYRDQRPRAKDDHIIIVGIAYYRPSISLCIGIGLPSGKEVRIHPQRLVWGKKFKLVTHISTHDAYVAQPVGYVTAAQNWLERNAAQD